MRFHDPQLLWLLLLLPLWGYWLWRRKRQAPALAACRTLVVDSENRPQRTLFCRIRRRMVVPWGKKPVKKGPLRSICSRRFQSPTGCQGFLEIPPPHSAFSTCAPFTVAVTLVMWCAGTMPPVLASLRRPVSIG